MNRLVVKHHQKKENDLLVIEDPHIINHVYDILKLKKNDSVKLCLLNRGLAQGQIKTLDRSKITIDIQHETEGIDSLIQLQIGLCRPPSTKKILEHGTSLGVKVFDFFKAELSEKSYLDSKVFEQSEHLCGLGLAQSGEYYQLPEVSRSLSFSPSNINEKYFLSFNTDRYLHHYSPSLSEPISFALGPERGWTEKEELMLLECGYKPLKIAETTLRVEIATFALLGQLHLIKNNI